MASAPPRSLSPIMSEVQWLTQALRAVPYDAVLTEDGHEPIQLGAAAHRAADLLEALEADNVRFYQAVADVYNGHPDPQKIAERVLTAPSYRAFYQ